VSRVVRVKVSFVCPSCGNHVEADFEVEVPLDCDFYVTPVTVSCMCEEYCETVWLTLPVR